MTITASSNAAIAEIEAVIGGWAEALRRKAAARVLAHGTDDCLVFSLAPPLKASDADAGGLEQWFSTWEGPLGFTLEDLDVSVSGDVAFGHYLGHVRSTRTTGEKADCWVRVAAVFRKMDGEWMVVHEHISAPVIRRR